MFHRKLKLVAGALVACGTVMSLHAQMAQDPLLSRTAAVGPNIVFMFDDSGSMPATAIYQYGGYAGGYGMSGPGYNKPTYDDTSLRPIITSPPTTFQGRSPDVNLIYYDPRVTYARRINSDGTFKAAGSTSSISSFNVYFYKPASSTIYSVTSVPVTSRGSGYPASGITASFPAPPAGGVQAAAQVVTAASPNVSTVAVVAGGAGYPSSGVTASFSAPGGAGGVPATGSVVLGTISTRVVTAVTVFPRGSGYGNATTVTFSAPPAGGVRATGTVVRGGGNRINSITIDNPGSGYTTAPTISLSNTGGGSGATFSTTLGTSTVRVITGIVVTNGGSGYTSVPTVTLGGTVPGYGASFNVTLGSTNVISAINVTNAGSGYVTPPRLTLAGTGSGSGVAYPNPPPTISTLVTPVNRTWDGSDTPTAASNYFNPYTPDAGGPLAAGASVIPYPVTASSSTASYPKFKNRTDCNATVCSWAQELQNYANWKTYHSTRLELAKTGIGLAFQPLNPTFRLGWGTINHLEDTSALDMGVRLYNPTVQSDFLTWLYGLSAPGNTPNRIALNKVGQYYQRADNAGPWADNPTGDKPVTSSAAANASHATCRRSYALLMTDGYYNDSFTLSDVDSTNGPSITTPISYQYTPVGPYSDTKGGTSFSNSFADIAMKYWVNDLRPDLGNNVRSLTSDEAFWQHLNFYAIGLGVKGTLNADDPAVLASLTGQSPARTLDWPAPATNSPASIDDMWHATVNGRGKMLNAKTSDELNQSIQLMMASIGAEEGTQSGVAVSTASLTSNTKKYTPRFTPITWTGNVTAYRLDEKTGNQSTVAWEVEKETGTDPLTGAKTYVSNMPAADSRNIYVGNGATSGTRAVPFTYAALSSAGLTAAMNGTVNDALIKYLRGDAINEDTSATSSSSTAIYRGRGTRLGDVVNSTPVFVKDTLDLAYGDVSSMVPGTSTYATFIAAKKARPEGLLFVGANDGMLHAFRDGTDTIPGGIETFAYVPRALLPTLNQLADKTYAHRFYVDGPNVETDAYFTGGTARWANVVLGTTGAGAGAPSSAGVSPKTAVYAIDVTSLNTSVTSLDASSVLWEVSSTSTGFAELGYVLSDVQAGATVGGQWVAIFGNGYESKSCQARLFIVNLETGALIKEINTGAGNCSGAKNGLGGVRIVRNSARQIIGAYAGDLQGNLWKFSLNDANSTNWKVDLGGSPLFKAGATQPITAAPAFLTLPIVKVPNPTTGYLVVAGTGKFYEVSDISTTATQSLYGIWDAVPFGAATIPAGSALTDKSLLVQQTINPAQVVNGNTFFSISKNAVDYVGTTTPSVVPPRRGWYIDMPNTGQRLVYPMDVLANRFTVADTISPANVSLDQCSNTTGGTGYLYIIDAVTGGGPTEAVLDTNGDNNVNEADLVSGVALSGTQNKADGRNVTLQIDKTTASERYVNLSGGSPGGTLITLTCKLLGTCPDENSLRFKSREWRQLFMR